MITLEREILSNFTQSRSLEWLETNGIGGYASSTVSGANSRRYHGLLVAATRPPLGRMVLLSKFEETVIVGDKRFEISCNQYPDKVYPEGFQFLNVFRLDPFPVWTFEVSGIMIEKSVFMPHGENTVVCVWKILDKSGIPNLKVELELRPLIAFRDHHHLRREDAGLNTEYQVSDGLISMSPYDELPTLNFAHNAVGVADQDDWYRNFEYPIERERGFDYHEDLYQPFCLTFDLATDAVVVASIEPRTASADDLRMAEIKRRARLVAAAGAKDELTQRLTLAADQFIVARGLGNTVIAGYHWFSDWGRDTMIALNGLTLATKRPEIAKSILTEFARHISQGMLPNRFPDAGETPEYNTVDATLWFFEAIRAYSAATGDFAFVRESLYDKLVEIIDWHVRGTRYGIHVDTDGLLYAGGEGLQLTWMDAKVGDWVVTPRTGKAVEIQALWFNAACIMSDYAERFGDGERNSDFAEMAEIARESFIGQFWNREEQCLFDVVNGGQRDGAIRPNQIFAVSLPHTMLGAEMARKVVDKVEAELLTPVGLRSLSPRDPDYVGVYIGTPLERDGSYHQGTVWSWLIGHFVDAYRRVHSKDAKAEKRINEIIDGLQAHLTQAMVGQISEIFDGDAPHKPRGCAAQAWSVAELLRVISRHRTIG